MEVFNTPLIWLSFGLFGLIMLPVFGVVVGGGIAFGFFILSFAQFKRDQKKKLARDAPIIDKHAEDSNNWKFPEHHDN